MVRELYVFFYEKIFSKTTRVFGEVVFKYQGKILEKGRLRLEMLKLKLAQKLHNYTSIMGM